MLMVCDCLFSFISFKLFLKPPVAFQDKCATLSMQMFHIICIAKEQIYIDICKDRLLYPEWKTLLFKTALDAADKLVLQKETKKN